MSLLQSENYMKYKHSTVSGTFDHFHLGHKNIIDQAFRVAPQVSVGIAVEKMTEHKILSSEIEPYEKRKKTVQEYIKSKYPRHRVSFFELSSIYGIGLQDKTLDSIIVTRESYKNAVSLNKKRSSKGMSPLVIIKIPFVKDNSGKIIRATRVRQGSIDRNGELTIEIFKKKKIYRLPQNLRPLLREPLGKVFKGTEDTQEETAERVARFIQEKNPHYIVTVGDVVSDLLYKQKIHINLSIVDLQTQRGTFKYGQQGSMKRKKTKFMNKPGTIASIVAKNTYQILKKGLTHKKSESVIIKGEEDLIALPVIILAPLGTFVIYGQRNLGVVVTKVTENVKNSVENLLSKFD